MILLMLIIGIPLYIFLKAWSNPNEALKPAYWYYKDKYGKTRKYRWL
jgi:hypothetical protein